MLAGEKCQKTQLRTDTVLVVTFLPVRAHFTAAAMIYTYFVFSNGAGGNK